MKTSNKRYIIKESKGGKLDRYNVFDTQEKRIIMGKLNKFNALGLEGKLNEKPHTDK